MLFVDPRPLYRRLPGMTYWWTLWQWRRLPLRLRAIKHQAVRGRVRTIGPIGGRLVCMP